VYQLQPNNAYVSSCIFLNISTINNNSNYTNIVLSGVTVQGTAQIWNMVSGGLPPTTSLTVTNVAIDWVANQQLSAPINLVYVWSTTTTNNNNANNPVCTDLSYSSWPQVILSNIRVQNSSTLGPFGVAPGLIQATDVAVSISEVVWLSPVYQLVQTQTSCFDSSFGVPDTTYQAVYTIPPVSISMFSASGFTYYGAWLLGIAGGQVSLTGFDIFNVSQYDNLQSAGIVYVAPLSTFTFTNSHFSGLGNVLTSSPLGSTHDSSAVYLIWNSASQQQLSNRSQTTNLLQSLYFTNNSLRPITLAFNTLTEMNPTDPLSTVGVSVQIDSCQFVNNNGTAMTSNPGGAIQAQASTISYSSTTYFTYYYTTIKNSVSISNCFFEANVATNYGGAISLGLVN